MIRSVSYVSLGRTGKESDLEVKERGRMSDIRVDGEERGKGRKRKRKTNMCKHPDRLTKERKMRSNKKNPAICFHNGKETRVGGKTSFKGVTSVP